MNVYKLLFLTENRDKATSWLCSMGQLQKTYSITIAQRHSLLSQPVASFDLIIIEVEATKKLNALRTCQRLRAHTRVPVLFLSSLDDEEYELEVYNAGADDYIVEPIDPDLLNAKLQAWQRWIVPATIGSYSVFKKLLA